MSKDAGFAYHQAETGFRYIEASSTIPGPGGRARGGSQRISSVDAPIGLSGVVVKVAAGAGDKCVAPAQSRPKRRQVLENTGEDWDSLDVPAVQWSSTGISVSQLTSDYHTQCPLLTKVTTDYGDDDDDFTRGQVSRLIFMLVYTL